MITVLGPRMLEQPWLLVEPRDLRRHRRHRVRPPAARSCDGSSGATASRPTPTATRGGPAPAASATSPTRSRPRSGFIALHDVDEAGAVVIDVAGAAADGGDRQPRLQGQPVRDGGRGAAAARGVGARSSTRTAAADLVLVNTCTVTATADEKSRAAVRRARRANPRRRDRRDRLLGPGRARGVRGGRRARRAWWATRTRPRSSRSSRGCCGRPVTRAGVPPLPTLSGVEAVVATPIDGIADDRASVERTRAFVKVQDGCSFYCTYCIIPRARGAERSARAGGRARGRAPGARRRAPRDRAHGDQHRHLRRRLVRARPARQPRPRAR